MIKQLLGGHPFALPWKGPYAAATMTTPPVQEIAGTIARKGRPKMQATQGPGPQPKRSRKELAGAPRESIPTRARGGAKRVAKDPSIILESAGRGLARAGRGLKRVTVRPKSPLDRLLSGKRARG